VKDESLAVSPWPIAAMEPEVEKVDEVADEHKVTSSMQEQESRG